MGLSAKQILANPMLHGCLRRQAQVFLAFHDADPRQSSVFATQQRWLMAHAALSLAFRRDGLTRRTEMTASRVLELVDKHDIASRNTADAFLKELLRYQIIVYASDSGNKRARPLELAESTLHALNIWLVAHLETLDGLDGGQRCAAYESNPDSLSRIQPLISESLMSAPEVREPDQVLLPFRELKNGGLVMDWLFNCIDPGDVGAERIPTGVLSIVDFARFLKLSRTHLDRKLREAEQLGSVGWAGRRGPSMMWVSKGLFAGYIAAQAVKLAIIDAACGKTFY